MSPRVLVAADRVTDLFADAAHGLGASSLSFAHEKDPRRAWQRALDERRPQVVLAAIWRNAPPDLLLDLRERGVPYAVFLLELPASRFALRPRSRAWRTALAGAEALIALSGFLREAWIARGAPPERFLLLSAGLPPSDALSLGRNPAPRTVLLDATGGCAPGLELVPKPLTIYVAGGMPRRPPRRHAFLPLPAPAAPALERCSAVLALPTREIGTSHWVAQAQLSGVPPVATARGGIAEQIIHGVSGFLAAPADLPGISETLEEALEQAQGSGLQLRSAAQNAAEAALGKLGQLCTIMAEDRCSEPALAIEFADWLAEHPRSEASVIAALRDEEAGEPRLRALVHAISRQRRLDLNHAIAFLRACDCRCVAYGPDPGARDAVARLQGWGLDPSPTPAMADAVVWEAEESPDLGALRRQFRAAKALVAITGNGVETLELG